jgi:hypothetical protein
MLKQGEPAALPGIDGVNKRHFLPRNTTECAKLVVVIEDRGR